MRTATRYILYLAILTATIMASWTAGFRWGHRAADKWWENVNQDYVRADAVVHPLQHSDPLDKARSLTNDGWAYECLYFDGKTGVIRPNYDEPTCWPKDKQPH